MKTSSAVVLAAFAIAGIASGATPASAAQTVPHLPVPKGAAVILNTGSTNTAGYRIVIEPSGTAHYIVVGTSIAQARVSASLTEKFFADLRRAMPLSRVRVEPCMKSASFGTMAFVWWKGERSLDISCPGDTLAAALNDDVIAIASALHLEGHAIHMLPNEPRKPLPASPLPAGSPLSAQSVSPLHVRLTARAF